MTPWCDFGHCPVGPQKHSPFTSFPLRDTNKSRVFPPRSNHGHTAARPKSVRPKSSPSSRLRRWPNRSGAFRRAPSPRPAGCGVRRSVGCRVRGAKKVWGDRLRQEPCKGGSWKPLETSDSGSGKTTWELFERDFVTEEGLLHVSWASKPRMWLGVPKQASRKIDNEPSVRYVE